MPFSPVMSILTMQPLTMVAQKMTKLLLIVSNMKLLQFSFLFNNENLIFLGKFLYLLVK